MSVAWLMLLVWLGIFALTTSPQLHQLLHRDAKSSTHQCVVTQVQQQLLVAGLVTFLAPLPAPSFPALSRRVDSPPLSSFDYRVSLSRGPPCGFSSTMVVG